MIFLVDNDIICIRCKKPARIKAEGGKLCLVCWRKTRKENREIKLQSNLNKCFTYKTKTKVTPREAKILDDVMRELEKKK